MPAPYFDLIREMKSAYNHRLRLVQYARQQGIQAAARAFQTTVPDLPALDWPAEVMETVRLIDVIWLRPDTAEIVAAFEVEKSTSIYSGILRLEDLARSLPDCTCNLFLIAPDYRESAVMAQLARPAFRDDLADMRLAFIPFGDLCQHCDALCKFGEDSSILHKIARTRPRL